MKSAIKLFLLSLFLLPSYAFAQFEGEININIYSSNDDKKEQEVSQMNMYVTPTRIFMIGEDKVSLMNGLNTSGVLIRNDVKDFVFLTGEKTGLQVTKTEIEGLFDMMGMMGESSAKTKEGNSGAKTSYEYTDRTKKLLGLDAYELIIKDEKDANKYISVWLTPNIDINWGMLGESWRGIPSDMKEVNDFSRSTIFNGKNFPLLVEAHEDGKVTPILEVTSLERNKVARAMVEIPSGVTTTGIRDFMMKVMMGN